MNICLVTSDICSFQIVMENMQRVKSCVERYGQDVNGADLDGQTALHVAAGRGNLQMCAYLVSHRADV